MPSLSQRFRLAGRVLDEQEQPVAGTRVRLRPGERFAISSDDGTFEFDGLERTRYSVSATNDNYYAWHVLWRPGEPDVILRLRLGATLIVHAYAERAPLVGARLVIDGEVAAITDAAGTAIVRGLMPRSYEAWLRAHGFPAEQVGVCAREDPGGQTERFFTLRRGAAIEGILLGPLRRPIAGAAIQVWPATRPGKYQTVTDVDGRWRVEAPAGRYQLFAWGRYGRSPSEEVTHDGRTPHRDIMLWGGPTIRYGVAVAARAIRRALKKPTRIAGIVVDSTGEPIIGAELSVLHGSVLYWRGHTDAHGRFDVEGLQTDEHEVSVRHGAPRFPDARPFRQRVRTGDTNARIVLPAGGTISGRVLLDGAPLPYFGVALVRYMGIGIRAEDGRFTIRHVAPGTMPLVIVAPGARRMEIESITVAAGQHLDVGEIKMERGQRIVGHVRDRAGTPVAGARVIMGRWGTRGHGGSQLENLFAGHFEVTTDAQGLLLFDGISPHPPPARELQIWATHHRIGASRIRAVPQSDATIDLEIEEVGRLAGHIVGMRGGRPFLHAVRADEPEFARGTGPDEDGNFEFDELPCGDYVISGEQVMSASVKVLPDQISRVTLAMTSATVELVVVVPLGRKHDLVIEPTSDGAGVGGRWRSAMIMDDEERCTLYFVRPGTYRVSLDGKTWKPIVVDAEPPEQTIDLR